MRREDAYPSKFMKSVDVKGKPIIAVISHVEMEVVGQGADQKKKPVMHLEGHKPMVVNATNWDALADAFGDDSDEWVGRKIKIRCVKTQYAGKPVDGLRVEPLTVKPAPKSTPDDDFDRNPDDEIAF